jgi:hypothetical protein
VSHCIELGLPQSAGVWRNCCDLSIGVLAHRLPDGARRALISHENESRMVAWVGRQSLRIKSKRRGMGRDRGHVWRRTLSNLWHTFQTPPRLVHPECAGPSGSGRYGQAAALPRAVAMYERRMRSADVWRSLAANCGPIRSSNPPCRRPGLSSRSHRRRTPGGASDGHCHINRKRSRLNEARGLKVDHAAFRAYVSSRQTSKIKERIIR